MIKPQNLLPNLSPRQPLEDEYISETDGLIYCSKCHTPRQKKIEFLGKIMFPIIRCQCQQEQYEKEEAKRKQPGISRTHLPAEIQRSARPGFKRIHFCSR